MEKQSIPIDQVIQMQFAKIGKLSFQIDIITQQMAILENENKQLKEQLKNTELIDTLKEK